MANKMLRAAGLGAVATVLSLGTAHAADVAPVVVPAVTPVVVAAAPAGFDFSGAYVGLAAGPVFLPGFGAIDWANFQVQAGFNIVRGRMLVGAEAKAGFYALSGVGLAMDADARVGMTFGGNLLAFATVGGGFYGPGFGSPHINFGAGVEVGLGSRTSLQLEAGGEWFSGFPIYPRVEIGLNFHFGR